MEPETLTQAEQFALLMQAHEVLLILSYTDGVPAHRQEGVTKILCSLERMGKELAYCMACDKFAEARFNAEQSRVDALRAAVRKVG